MPNRVSHLLADVLRPPTDERSAVVAALIDSLPVGKDDGISEAWRAELLKRREDLRSGRTIAPPWAEVKARLSTCEPLSRAARAGCRSRTP